MLIELIGEKRNGHGHHHHRGNSNCGNLQITHDQSRISHMSMEEEGETKGPYRIAETLYIRLLL